MRGPQYLFLFAAMSILALNGCYYDNEEALYPGSFCDTTNVTFANSIEPFVQTNCATPNCHVPGGAGNGDLTVFANIASKVADGRFLQSIRRENGVYPMPPENAVSACDLSKVEIWIAAGAQHN
ncbi:MAG: hypothetical protein IPG11_01745 [Flavobacteriales bacterium]|nr:hypothetical protein [Flavobacteriales bacterium]